MKILFQIGVALISMMRIFSGSSHAAHYNVSNTSELIQKINLAQGGDVITLANGNYGDILIYGKHPTGAIKIQAQNTHGAIIEKLQITNSSKIHIQGINFSHPKRSNEHDWSQIVTLNQANQVSINHSVFSGSDDGVNNDIVGLGLRKSQSIALRGNTFHNLEKGAIFDDISYIVFSYNTLAKIAVDGLGFGNNARHITIDSNRMSNFTPCDIFDTATCRKHPDFIQMWNNHGTQPNHSITITNNTLLRGNGGVTQGILIQANNPTFQNSDILIEGNTIEGSHIHGISVVDGENITIRNNSVTTSSTAVNSPFNPNIWTINPRIRLYNIDGAELENNTTNWIDLINSTNVNASGNTESMR